MSVKTLATVYMAELQAPAMEGTFTFGDVLISMQSTQLVTKICVWGGDEYEVKQSLLTIAEI